MKSIILSLKGKDKKIALKKFFDLINLLQEDSNKKITESEKDILCYFYLENPNKGDFRFISLSKKIVKKRAEEKGWKLTSQNLHNKLSSLLNKGYLTVADKELNIIVAKSWLEKTLVNLISSIDNNEVFDVKFRFGNDNT